MGDVSFAADQEVKLVKGSEAEKTEEGGRRQFKMVRL